MKSIIEIGVATDSAYKIPTTVFLKSLFENHRQGELRINLLHINTQTSAQDVSFWENYTLSHGQYFNAVSIEEERLNIFPEDVRHSKSTYNRLLITELLPEADKLLYLDADIVVCESLAELWNTDICDYYAAAVKETSNIYAISDQWFAQHIEALGIKKEDFYFQAGVMLLNLKKMREDNILEKYIEFVEQHRQLMIWSDQDVVNSVLSGKIYYIPPKYNFNFLVERDIPYKLWTRSEVNDAKKRPVIIHYIGPVKPWHFLSVHPKNSVWWHYLKKSPFKGFRPYGYTITKFPKRIFLYLTKSVERHLSLDEKRAIGKLIPSTLKKFLKRKMGKKS